MNIFGVLEMITHLNYDVWEVVYRKGKVLRIEGDDKSKNNMFQLSVDMQTGTTTIRYDGTTLLCHYSQLSMMLSTLPKSSASISRETYVLYYLCKHLRGMDINFHLVNSLSKSKGITYTFNNSFRIGVSFIDCESTPTQLCRVRYADKFLDVPYKDLIPQLLNLLATNNVLN